MGGLKKILSCKFEIDHAVSPCFTLWSFSVEFCLFLTDLNKLNINLVIKGYHWKKKFENKIIIATVKMLEVLE
jgi:hypothetical protein